MQPGKTTRYLRRWQSILLSYVWMKIRTFGSCSIQVVVVLGNVIGTYFIELAKKEAQHRFGHVPDKDLSYLQRSNSFNDYVEAVEWAQRICI